MNSPPDGFQLLTSPGPAAIATLRVCGRAVEHFLRSYLRARPVETWQAGMMMRAALLDERGESIDDVLVAVHAAGPDWDVCVHLHGSPWLVRRCTELLVRTGLKPLDPLAASPWSTESLIDAEAYALMPHMFTLRGLAWLEAQRRELPAAVRRILTVDHLPVAARECRALAARGGLVDWFRRPLRVAIVGPPNAGKSTLTNALAREEVALVSDRPGTTRDWVEARGDIDGLPVAWLDTAGLRPAGDAIEAAGIESAHGLLATADAVVLVLDGVNAGVAADVLRAWTGRPPSCVAFNKCDLGLAWRPLMAALPAAWRSRVVAISAASRVGLGALAAAVVAGAGRELSQLSFPAAFTDRQRQALLAGVRCDSLGALRERLASVIGSNSVAGGRNEPI